VELNFAPTGAALRGSSGTTSRVCVGAGTLGLERASPCLVCRTLGARTPGLRLQLSPLGRAQRPLGLSRLALGP
jgi:hypothetical protein